MKITDSSIRLLCLLALLELSACGYIKSLFPDKEKDYQYTTEIPELVIPSDLKNSQLPSLPKPGTSAVTQINGDPSAVGQTQAAPEPTQTVVTPLESNGLADPAAPLPADATVSEPTTDAIQMDSNPAPAKREPILVELVKTAGQASLRINAPFDKAWRTIDKALSRKSIEVTSRNTEEKQFNVRYDASEQKLEDSSIWDEANFLFGGFNGDEKTYALKLVETDKQTDVIILDDDQKPSTEAGAIGLLELLQKTIKADFAK